MGSKEKIVDFLFSFVSKVLLVIIGMLVVFVFFSTKDVPSPQDFIKEEDVVLLDGGICVLGNYTIARISNTKSMDPTLDKDSLVILKKTKNIQVGDIVAYPANDGKRVEIIVHRVIKIKNDSVIVKGDNNFLSDKYKIKKKGIIAEVVGILY